MRVGLGIGITSALAAVLALGLSSIGAAQDERAYTSGQVRSFFTDYLQSIEKFRREGQCGFWREALAEARRALRYQPVIDTLSPADIEGWRVKLLLAERKGCDLAPGAPPLVFGGAPYSVDRSEDRAPPSQDAERPIHERFAGAASRFKAARGSKDKAGMRTALDEMRDLRSQLNIEAKLIQATGQSQSQSLSPELRTKLDVNRAQARVIDEAILEGEAHLRAGQGKDDQSSRPSTGGPQSAQFASTAPGYGLSGDWVSTTYCNGSRYDVKIRVVETPGSIEAVMVAGTPCIPAGGRKFHGNSRDDVTCYAEESSKIGARPFEDRLSDYPARGNFRVCRRVFNRAEPEA
jgi:hypothetical protein